MKFLDQAKVYIRSGDGGAGCVSFRREKFIEFGGPDGGDGGRGGDVVVECAKGLNTLIDFRYQQHFKAKVGVHGMGKNRAGGRGADAVLKVPAGTQIFDEDGETLLADMRVEGERVCISRGGNGGFGNAHFTTSTNRAPRRVNPGEVGIERTLILRLKLIADAGLVGLPNAGKSTIVNTLLRRAAAKIEARAGVTRQVQWFRLSPTLELMDTPGVLPPKISSGTAQWKLAMCDGVPAARYDAQEVIAAFHQWATGKRRDGVPDLHAFATSRGFVRRGAEIDYHNAAVAYVRAFNDGVFGRFSLEGPHDTEAA